MTPVACAMCIISNWEANFNLVGDWTCPRGDLPVCPVCQSQMKYRDSRRRHIRVEGGVKHWGTVRRYLCKRCHRLHTELPLDLCPYKHYRASIIEDVLDDVVSEDDPGYEDYPCEVTIKRWNAWIDHNSPFIDGYLRSVGFRLLDLGERFLKCQGSLLNNLRDSFCARGECWLSFINRVVYNTGASLEPWPPFYAYAP